MSQFQPGDKAVFANMLYAKQHEGTTAEILSPLMPLEFSPLPGETDVHSDQVTRMGYMVRSYDNVLWNCRPDRLVPFTAEPAR